MRPATTPAMTRRIQAAHARKDFAKVLESSSRGERIKVTRYNKTIGVVISKRDLARLEHCERQHVGSHVQR